MVFENVEQSYQGDIGALDAAEAQAVKAAGVDGLGYRRICRVTYDFAVDGGAIGPIVPSGALALPSKAVVVRAWAHVLTAFTGLTGTTLAVSIEAAGDLLAADTLANIGFSTTGFKELIPDGTAAKFVQTTVGTRKLTLTPAVHPLTAGKAIFHLEYAVTA